jgi:AraC-like DNA-binding protein
MNRRRQSSLANFEWLLREATDGRTLTMGERNVIDDGRWRATIERLLIGPGLRLFLTDAEAREDVAVEMRSSRTEHWVASQVTVTGRAEVDFLDGQHTHASAEQALLFRLSGSAATYSLAAGTKFLSAGYSLDVERVERLFDGDVPEVLHGLIEPEIERSCVVAQPGDRMMRFLAGNLFRSGLNGPLRTLMMEGAVIQLLALQAAVSTRQRRPRRRRRRALTRHERDAVHEARQLLLADMRRPPTLGELALSVGLNEKRLNTGFRTLFGATAFDMLRNERLAHAAIALQSEQVSLKDIAFRVGYNHVNNFISAFKARYGAPPRRYVEQS